MTIKIKNRTSTVPVSRTAARIEEMLAQAGASQISKTYASGELVGLEFSIQATYGLLHFRMPVNTAAAFAVLTDGQRLSKSQRDRVREQAARTAWKLAQDQIELYLSMVALKQAELIQVMLPYAVSNGQTLFDAVKQGGYRALLAAPAENQQVEIVEVTP